MRKIISGNFFFQLSKMHTTSKTKLFQGSSRRFLIKKWSPESHVSFSLTNFLWSYGSETVTTCSTHGNYKLTKYQLSSSTLTYFSITICVKMFLSQNTSKYYGICNRTLATHIFNRTISENIG